MLSSNLQHQILCAGLIISMLYLSSRSLSPRLSPPLRAAGSLEGSALGPARSGLIASYERLGYG